MIFRFSHLPIGGGGNKDVREFCIGRGAAAALVDGRGGGAAGRGGKAVGEDTSMGACMGRSAEDVEAEVVGGLMIVEGTGPLAWEEEKKLMLQTQKKRKPYYSGWNL